jgi:hypothetical protein
MNERESEGLAPELRALLDAERGRGPLAPEVSARLGQRIAHALGLPPASIDPGSSATAGHALSEAARAHGVLRLLAGARLVPIACAFVAGGATGAAITAKVMRTPAVAPAPIMHAAPAASASPPMAVPGLEPPVERAPSAALPVQPEQARHASSDAGAAKPTATPRTRADQDRDLSVERSMIELARSALAHGRAADALAAIESHARRFRHGRLTEERESLRVAALAALGRSTQARAAAAEFHRAFPNSLFGSGVDELLRSIP